MVTTQEIKALDMTGKELEGNLKIFKFPEVLQFLSMGGMTGILTITQDDRRAELAFREGKIVNVSSNERYIKLGTMLVSTGRISQKSLDDALKSQEYDGGQRQYLGEMLIERSLIAIDELRAAIRLQIEEELWELFSWDSGWFRFEQGLDREPDTVTVEMDVAPLLHEGVRRMEEWRVLCSQIDKPSEILYVNPEFPPRPEPPLDEKSWKILSLVNGRLPVQAIVRISNLGKFETYWALDRLLRSDLIMRSATPIKSEFDQAEEEEVNNLESTVILNGHSKDKPLHADPSKKSSLLGFLGRGRKGESDVAEAAEAASDSAPAKRYETDVALVCAAINRYLTLLQGESLTPTEPLEPDWVEKIWQSAESRFPRADILRIKANRLNSTRFDRYARLEGSITRAVTGMHDDCLDGLRLFWNLLKEHTGGFFADPKKADHLADKATKPFTTCSAEIRSPEFSFIRWKDDGFLARGNNGSAPVAPYNA